MNTLRRLWQNPILLPIYTPVFLLAFWQGMLTPILPLYATDFEVSYWQVGLLLGALELGMLLGDLPAGFILNKLGQRKAMLLGAGTAVFATVALFWAPSIFIAFLFRFASGFGLALYNITIHLILTEGVRLGNRGKAIAGLGGVNRIGHFVGPAIGGTIGELFGLRVPFLFSAIIGVVLLATLALTLAKVIKSKETAVQLERHSMLQVLKNHVGVLSAAGTGVLLAQTIRAGRRVIIPLFGAEILGLDVQQIGIIISVSSAIDMSLFPVAGVVMDKIGRKWSIVPSFLIQGLGMFLIPFTAGFSTLLLAASIIGFGNGLGSGTMMTIGADLSPDNNRSEFLATWRFIGDTGFALAPNIVGVVADLFMLGTAVYVIAGAGLLAGVVFGRYVPETLKRETAVL